MANARHWPSDGHLSVRLQLRSSCRSASQLGLVSPPLPIACRGGRASGRAREKERGRGRGREKVLDCSLISLARKSGRRQCVFLAAVRVRQTSSLGVWTNNKAQLLRLPLDQLKVLGARRGGEARGEKRREGLRKVAHELSLARPNGSHFFSSPLLVRSPIRST